MGAEHRKYKSPTLDSFHCLQHRGFSAARRVAAIDTTGCRVLAPGGFEREVISERTNGGDVSESTTPEGRTRAKDGIDKAEVGKVRRGKRKTPIMDMCRALETTRPTLYRQVAAAATSVPHRGNHEVVKR